MQALDTETVKDYLAERQELAAQLGPVESKPDWQVCTGSLSPCRSQLACFHLSHVVDISKQVDTLMFSLLPFCTMSCVMSHGYNSMQ